MEDYRDKAVLERLYVEEGLTVNEVAKRLFVVPETIRYYMKRHGIQTRGQKNRIFVVAGKEMSYKDISMATGLSVTLLKSRVRRGWADEDLFRPKQKRGGYHGRLQRS